MALIFIMAYRQVMGIFVIMLKSTIMNLQNLLKDTISIRKIVTFGVILKTT